MGRKKASKSGFVMAEEVRNVVSEKPDLTGPEVYATLVEKFPGEDINKNSCIVAVYSAREKLGVKGGRKKKSKGGRKPGRPAAKASSKVDMEALQAAAKFISQIGDAEKAADAVKQVKALQLK